MVTTVPNPEAVKRHRYLTEKQAAWLVDLINTRIGITSPEFPAWRERYLAISNRAEFEAALNELRPMPVSVQASTPQATASEEGLYLDPNTLKMYRLGRTTRGELTVSIYSETAARRIELQSGQEVKKGKWTRATLQATRIMLRSPSQHGYSGAIRILAEWAMTDQDKVEYVTGICNFCYRGLVDARSVRANYGPDCAKQHSLPWGD